MSRILILNVHLKRFYNAVDDLIRQGKFNELGQRGDLHEMNSRIFSDFKASLAQMSRRLNPNAIGTAQAREVFTLAMLKQLVPEDNKSPNGILRRAYLSEAEKAERSHYY